MKELTEFSEIKALPIGTKIMRISGAMDRTLKIVGTLPYSYETMVFCEGDNVTTLHPSNVKNSRWFTGDFDADSIGKILIEHHQKQINSITEFYLNKNQ